MNWWELQPKAGPTGKPAWQDCEITVLAKAGESNAWQDLVFQPVSVLSSNPVIPTTLSFMLTKEDLAESSNKKFDSPDCLNVPVQVKCQIKVGDTRPNFGTNKITFMWPKARKAGGYGGRQPDTPEQIFGKILTHLTGHALSNLKPSELFPNQLELDNLKLLSTWIILAAKEYGTAPQKPTETSQPPI